MKNNKSYNPLFASTGFIVLLFFLFSHFAFAITDTTKVSDQHYALNDPRNPNCPCHKLQKQAEDEFAQQNNNKDQFNNIENDKANNINNKEINKPNLTTEIREMSIKINPVTTFTKYKRKNKNIWITKIKFKFSKGTHRIKKVVPDYEICFKW